MSKGPWKPKKVNVSVEGASGDTAPKVSHKAKTHKITQDMIDALVQLINLPVSFMASDYALTETESAALVVAITDLAAQNVWVNNIIYSLVTANRLAEVPMVVGAIAVNKLIVAKKVPEMTGIATNVILESVAARRGKGGMAAGPTRRPDRADGERQDDTGEGASETAGLRSVSDNQAGHSAVAKPLDQSQPGEAD